MRGVCSRRPLSVFWRASFLCRYGLRFLLACVLGTRHLSVIVFVVVFLLQDASIVLHDIEEPGPFRLR